MRLVRVQLVGNGGTARTPMALAALEEQLRPTRAYDAVELTGAGLLVTAEGAPASPGVAEALAEAGLSADGYATTQFEIEDIPAYDLVVLFEHRHLDLIAGAGPPRGWRDHVRVLREFDPVASALGEHDVPDPTGRDAASHREALKQIRSATPRLATHVAGLADVTG